MQPTVGRIVHVLVDPKLNNGSDVAPAIITRVWNEQGINVRVLRDNYPGPEEWMTSISLHESREALDEHAEAVKAANPAAEVTVRGAFWPPRA
jgi:hypothetical protein